MNAIKIDCKAKINLGLDVIGEREDGYHEVQMIMLAVDLCDQLKLITRTDGEIRLLTNAQMPKGMDNLACRAAALFFEQAKLSGGVDIEIEKRIPMGAGLGGGSADAAGVLHGLNRLFGGVFSQKDLMRMGLSLGADVPFCLLGGCALAEGIGEKLTVLPLPPRVHFVIAKPPVSVSTKWVYEHLRMEDRPQNLSIPGVAEGIRSGNLAQMVENTGNILETVTIPAFPEIGEYKRKMREMGAELSLMSGSGSAVFGMFVKEEAAERAYRHFCLRTDEVYRV